jgi:hypothetical protein
VAPFGSESRHEIKRRSDSCSELDGKEYLPSLLRCGHINHDKKHPDYNNPENGLRVTIWQECAYHMIHQPDPSEIGLSRENNMRAIRCNMQDLIEMGYTYDEVRELIGTALGQWEEWKKEKLIREHLEIAHEINGCGEENKSYIYSGEDCLYSEPDDGPVRKSKPRYKGYIPGGL